MSRSDVIRAWSSRTALAVLLAVVTAASAAAQAKPRIAVMNFENNSTWSFWGDKLGAAAADELVTHLGRSERFSALSSS
jgi:curli biogenesis system outer membrane secretion channel CsgG